MVTKVKERIVAADATDAVKVSNSDRVLPPFTLELPPGAPPAPRALIAEAETSLESAASAARVGEN